MKSDFVKIDLHVHTPASSCYKGPKSDDEYLRILRFARSNDIKILGISDHNSIDGYKRILNIKEKLANERKSLSLITDSKQVKNRISKIDDDLEIFKSILILPAIEFEVSNGIHLLVVFNDTTPIEDIHQFLSNGGYNQDNFGIEEPNVLSNWDIFKLYEESAKYDCLVIDAHTDSNKGILNTIPQGNTRANCFSSPYLAAVCYRSEEQKEKLANTIKSQRPYLRKTPLPFLKFSDAHIAEEVGKPLSWVKVEKLSFPSLKIAFSNPSEMVSTEEPSMARILDDLIKLDNSIGIPDVSEDSQSLLKKYICAFGNTDGGYILLGVSKNKSKIGLVEKSEGGGHALSHIINPIFECFSNIEPAVRPTITQYNLQSKKHIFSIHVQKSPTLINIKNDRLVYSIKKGTISVLKATEIEAIAQDKLLVDIESKISNHLLSVQNECCLIKNIFCCLPIIRFFDCHSHEAIFRFEVAKSISLEKKNIDKLKKIGINGTSRGNIYYLDNVIPPRLTSTYLRYSIPLFTLAKVKLDIKRKETIYIVPGGAVFYSTKNFQFFSESLPNILKISGDIKPSAKFIVAFLKSSFNLWYLKNKLDNIDIFQPEVFNNLRLPVINLKHSDSSQAINEIHNSIDEIIKLESNYLVKQRKYNIKDDKQREILSKLTTEHNSKVDLIAYDIDKLIYKLLDLSENQINVIEENLRLNDIYLPPLSRHCFC